MQRRRAAPPSPHPLHASTRLVIFGVSVIRRHQCPSSAATINFTKQQRRRSLQHRQRSTLQQIGKPHDHLFIAAANRQHQARIRVKLHTKSRRRSATAHPGKHSLAQRPPPRHSSNHSLHRVFIFSR